MHRIDSAMTIPHQFAKHVFLTAGIYGLVTLLPRYFTEAQVGLSFPPPINRPGYYYGLIGAALAWQFAFWLTAHDVQRYRSLMVPVVLEKPRRKIATILLFA